MPNLDDSLCTLAEPITSNGTGKTWFISIYLKYPFGQVLLYPEQNNVILGGKDSGIQRFNSILRANSYVHPINFQRLMEEGFFKFFKHFCPYRRHFNQSKRKEGRKEGRKEEPEERVGEFFKKSNSRNLHLRETNAKPQGMKSYGSGLTYQRRG